MCSSFSSEINHDAAWRHVGGVCKMCIGLPISARSCHPPGKKLCSLWKVQLPPSAYKATIAQEISLPSSQHLLWSLWYIEGVFRTTGWTGSATNQRPEFHRSCIAILAILQDAAGGLVVLQHRESDQLVVNQCSGNENDESDKLQPRKCVPEHEELDGPN